MRWGKDPLAIPSRAALWHLYWEQKISSTEIARRWGVKANTVRGWLRKANIPVRSKSEAIRLALAEQSPRPITNTDMTRANAVLAVRRQENPEKYRERAAWQARRLNRLKHLRQGPRPVPCGWCGSPCMRTRSARERHQASCCNRSHASCWIAHRRWHLDEPRPLILQRLHEGADPAEIGAGELETEAYRLEWETPLLPQAVEPVPLPRPAPPAAPRKQKALAPEQIGSVGEALLRAAKKGQP
jgi:transposase-like protein